MLRPDRLAGHRVDIDRSVQDPVQHLGLAVAVHEEEYLTRVVDQPRRECESGGAELRDVVREGEALLLVDGDDVTTDADALAKVAVTGEVVAHTKGPKIRIHHFKNKTGYHRRLGHRQPLTQVKVTGIESGK